MNTRNRLPEKSVTFYLNLSCLFDPAEVVFLLHMVDMEYMKQSGYNTAWSKEFLLLRMNLGIRLFDRVTKKLISMGLLSKDKVGNKYAYSLDMKAYRKLVGFLSLTNDIFKLKAFCETVFIKGKRKIQDVTGSDLKIID